MKWLLIVIASCCLTLGWNQLDSRSFSFDFGDILEKNGKVSHDFELLNWGEDTIQILDIESSCGCTSFFIGSKEILPHTAKYLKVFYNPTGRPGRFHKSVRVRYSYQGKDFEAMFTVRGNVIRDKTDKEANKITDLKIQPFDVLPVSPYDTSFAFLPRLEEFINGITYEIDLHGFAVLAIEHTSYTISNKGKMDGLIRRLKKRIAKGLVERGYQDYQVTWRETEFDLNFTPDWAMSRISIYSTRYTSEDVYFYKVHRETKEENNKDYKHLFWSYKAHADTFDLKKILADLNSVLDLKLMAMDSRILKFEYAFDASKILSKKATKFNKKLISSLYKRARQNYALQIGENTTGFDSDSLVVFKAFEVLEELPQQKVQFLEKESNIIPPLLPLVHYDFMNSDKILDTSDVDMKRILANSIIHIQHGKKIVFNIESSISHYPKKDQQDPLYHARQNSKKARELIDRFMKKRGVDSKMYEFNQLPLVQGPSYSKKYEKSFYDRFEYLNVLPTFKEIDTIEIRQIKYMVNFNSNAFTLDSNATMFKVFMRGIIDEINHYGFSKIILESSSSKAPTRTKENYSNDVISYKRAEETRDIMKNYLHRNGIDPSRLILVEERCLVQGPEYELDYFENKEKYKQFQYIKIIPHRLLSE